MITDLFSINSSLHAIEQLVQQKMKLCSSPSSDESCDNRCYPSSTWGNLRYFKSHTDATSNCKMRENFLQDFPGENSASYVPEYTLF
jgi:hypothetical protein